MRKILEGRGEASGEEIVRHKPLGVCSAHSTLIHSPGSQVALRLWLPKEPEMAWGGRADTLWTLSVTTTASLALTGTSVSQALESVNDSCPQLSWGRNCRNKFQIQPAFRKPTATGKFSLHCLWKKNKDPNLHHRTRCSASLMQEWQLK